MDSLFNAFRIGIYRFQFVAKDPLYLPRFNKANTFRGAFGHTFRRLCCIPQCKDPRSCPLLGTCPYKIVFEPSPPPAAERLSKNQDIPRPFIFRAPQTEQRSFQKNDRFQFELVLIGRAVDFLPYFVLSFRELAVEGLGLNRARCALERVEELAMSSNSDGTGDGDAKVIYESQDEFLRSAGTLNAEQWVEASLRKFSTTKANGPRERITIRFLTPTFLRANGEVVRRPEFHHVFKRLRDRINALCSFFGHGPLDADFRGLGQRAEKVRTISAQIEWIERFRTSSRTRQKHELSGFIGEATYEGELGEFLPWVALGELVHVGRHAAWGNGWYSIG